MQCELTVSSAFSGENSSVKGWLELNETRYEIDAEGSATDRGTRATVNGETFWWCGTGHPKTEGPEGLEAKIEEIFEKAWDAAEADENVDEDGEWAVTVVNGEVQKIEQILDE